MREGGKLSAKNRISRYANDTNLMAESKEETKSLLMRVKEESIKAGLKLNSQKTKIMVSGPITSPSWYLVPSPEANRREKSGNSDGFYFCRLQNNNCRW